ncbi:hypothetical protein [Hymenobacter volaticus]|uniref:Uncharacterized protein n=1 Tax=Hymenobacter volaticus TaxID=2932254 RepID=A0ABY4G515_9BACT|nr:hypothetical protein [Hymenobacter volaticus]UOQ65978.1 hypothetical protein MUN86_21090 [Hymenobacter volaticus]
MPQALVASPPLEPLQIAREFVDKDGWPEMKEHLCCEAEQQAKTQTLGQQIPARLQRSCQLLQQGASTAVVAVELRDSLSRNDFYLHFAKEDDAWKLQAIRSLSMTQLGPPMLKLLTTMPPAEVAQYNQKHPDADHDFTVGNLKLWIGADADIIDHFTHHQTDFQKVLRLVQTRKYLSADTTAANEAAANTDPEVRTLLRKLYISRVTQQDTDCSSCIEFIIGGRIDNTVGLLYQPKAADVPKMNPDRLIVVRPIAKGWYLYKTTSVNNSR